MKHCELCKAAARIYCESDQASLCWTCDAKVHSANFLVARHSRAILCNSCHSPTPWSSSGSDLAVAVAVCESCFAGDNDRSDDLDFSRERSNTNIDEIDDDEDDEEEVENEYGENQVVPWSSAATPPPPASSSSSEGEDDSSSSYGGGEASASSSHKKRSREDLVVVSSLKRRSELKTRSSAESLRKTRTIQVSQAKQTGSVVTESERSRRRI